MKVLNSSKNPKGENLLYQFTNGVDVDQHLALHEVKVQKAWAQGLAKIGLLKKDEAANVCTSLDRALDQMAAGTFLWSIEDEDIHMNLESFLTKELGETGKRTHLGRSRNDLIATTLRLFVADSLSEITELTVQNVQAIAEKSKEYGEVIVPGMTHLQNGQPIRFGHGFSSHGWALLRDLESIDFAKSQALKAMPLGSGALAGTTVKIDLDLIAKDLGFKSAPQNSYDSVGDRDFILSALTAFSSIAIHLSRLSEDVIIWSSAPFGLLKLPMAWSTGSSIMPNKRNPDVPELIRAKAAHVISALTNAQMIVKSLPTSYASDLHEMKSVFLRSFSEIHKCLSILPLFISELTVDKTQAQINLSKGHLLATEIANELALSGVPFREAYAQTAALVEEATGAGVSVEKLAKDRLQKVYPKIAATFEFTYEKAVESRDSSGGTSLKRTLEGIAKLQAQAQAYMTSTAP